MSWDYVIIGSGFGGSVSALRLVEKGYKVLVLEKGRRLEARDFPSSNWNLKRWLWLPQLGFRGLFKMTFLPNVTALSGVGVGGGSLVYANTLPIPKDEYFTADSWGHLADWKAELMPHYQRAREMLGATENPAWTHADRVLADVAKEIGREDHHHPTTVAVYFGEPGQTVPDPYHGGEGPDRTGCILCGGCMIGCKENAKNTLDKNYLYLAEKKGLTIQPDSEVVDLLPLEEGGYELVVKRGASLFGRKTQRVRAPKVILAGGVLGTVNLLLKLKESSLPRLSDRLGHFVRTNSEVLMGVTTQDRDVNLSEGVAITSILHTDEHSHLEPVRYPHGSGAFRTLMSPHSPGGNPLSRLARGFLYALRHPWRTLRAYLVPDWARYTMILLYMRTLDGHLRMKLGRHPFTLFRRGVTTEVGGGPRPTAAIPEASELAYRIAKRMNGYPGSLITETLLGIPTTAHILGGCVIGKDASEGVIDAEHRVFGYDGMYVIDGSAISANPGVNPSLSICALAERAMTFIPPKDEPTDPEAEG
ncbi:MAG: GMC family oxidoreductase [Deltaproteobacteria bacterium]|nr:GMC family oxidoreductase [Deltaproteobacteria bacterium]